VVGYSLFWDVTQCKLVGSYQRFRTNCLVSSSSVKNSRIQLHPHTSMGILKEKKKTTNFRLDDSSFMFFILQPESGTAVD